MDLNRKLSDTLQDDHVAASIAADCTELMNQQVAAKGGIGGMAIKATYGVVKGVGADYIPGAIQRLLPDAIAALDPLWEEGVQAGDPVAHLSQNCDRTADLILSVTDARIERASNRLICSSYGKLRKSVKNDIAAAVPGLAQIMAKHASV
jgi:hypothetical protein